MSDIQSPELTAEKTPFENVSDTSVAVKEQPQSPAASIFSKAIEGARLFITRSRLKKEENTLSQEEVTRLRQIHTLEQEGARIAMQQRNRDVHAAERRAEIAEAERNFALTVNSQNSAEKNHYRNQAETNEITGLSSGRVYEARLGRALSRLEDGTAKGRVVIYSMDLNGLGAVNDGISHEAGDALLKGVARVLSSEQREHEPAYHVAAESHIHGDEFAAVLEDVTDVTTDKIGEDTTVSGAMIWTNRKVVAFQEAQVVLEDGTQVANGISIAGGYVEIDAKELQNKSPEEKTALMQKKREQADNALYAAKYLSKKQNKELRAAGKPENSVIFLSIEEYNKLDQATLDEIEAYRQQKAAEKKDK